mgnify:CR=1 FL=1
MFSTFFLASLGGLFVSLILSVFLKRFARAVGAALLFFICTTLLLLGGMLTEKLGGGHFSFLQPAWLFLLILPIVILILRIFAGQAFHKPIAYPLTAFLPDHVSFSALANRYLPLLLKVSALCLFIIALARPVAINTTKLPPTQGIDIMMIIDGSASMANQDFFPNRFVAAQKTANNFISKRFNDRIGLVVFARDVALSAPLTLDHDAVQELVASLFIGIVNPQLTAIGDALGVAAKHLKDSSAKSKVILLLTDGSNNAGTVDPVLAAKSAAAYGIKVYTIATASPPGTTVFSSAEDEIDEGLLMSIAKETGGEFYRAKNELELQNIYNKINELEKTDFTQTDIVSRTDIYRPFLLTGLALLLLAFVLRKLILIKVP